MNVHLEVCRDRTHRSTPQSLYRGIILRLDPAPTRCLQIQRSQPTVPYLAEFGRREDGPALGGPYLGNLHQAYVLSTTAAFDEVNNRAIKHCVAASALAAACSLGASLTLPFYGALPIVIVLCGALLALGIYKVHKNQDPLREMRTAQVGMRLHDRYEDLTLDPGLRDLIDEHSAVIDLAYHAYVGGLYDRRLEPLFEDYLALVNSHFA